MRSCRSAFCNMKTFWIITFVLMAALCTTIACGEKDRIVIGKIPYISLNKVARLTGMKPEVLKHLHSLRLKGHSRHATFEIHKKDAILNGIRVFMGEPVLLYKQHLYISEVDYDKSILPLLFPQKCQSAFPYPIKRIVLDPGHGGTDPGAQNKAAGISEKQLTLSVALKLQKILQQKGFEVLLTRKEDQYLTLSERSEKAIAYKADLFVSLHFNAASNTTASGIETYAFTPCGQASTGRSHPQADDFKSYPGNQYDIPNACLAFCIQTALQRSLHANDRGVKRARFAVLKEMHCPAVLIEAGFISNPKEAQSFKKEAYQEKLAQAITTGILSYTSSLASIPTQKIKMKS